MQPGEVVALSIASVAADDQITVRAFGRDVPAYRVSDHEWRAVLGIDLDVKPGAYQITVHANGSQPATSTQTIDVRPRVFRTRRLTVDPAFVTPPPEEEARIEREAKLLAETWAGGTAAPLWSSPFVRPVPHEANSAFGTRSVVNGTPRNAHGGADFLSPAGTPVHAPNAGIVAVARPLYFSGNTVVIDHGAGVFSMLAHFSRIDVKEGDHVAAGDLVGLVGATGRVTGPHLHWAVRAAGARVDPLSLLAVQP
jgi:murein DD-endopeptidase MepM/ murein hydrolase activator NlpD